MTHESVLSALRQSPVGAGTYVNPVSRPFADTFADPSVIRGKDGWWYSYGTSDPLRDGGAPHRIPIARSHDLVSWTFVGDAFTAASTPTWAAADAGIWAPDIRYVDGQYRMYYVVTQTTLTAERDDNAIGMATAPTPAGPWRDSGAPVVGPRRGAGPKDDFLWTFDPSAVTDTDGSQWLFYGSYYGGIHVAPLSRDGRRVTGASTQVAIDNKFEGAYVVRHGGYWYLFASTANCCAGPTTGYSVQVGRSRDLRGPYVDRQGVRLTASRAGGTPAIVQNGNRWIGAGHNAIATDVAGQDWAVYHAIDRRHPYLTGTDGINRRPMLLDRLDWVDGWPALRAGRGPSALRQSAPVTGGARATDFTTFPGALRRTGSWTTSAGVQSGRFLHALRAGSVLTRTAAAGTARVEADLRSSGSAYGLRVANRVRFTINPRTHRARVSVPGHSSTVALPAGFRAGAWHSVSLQVVGGTARAQISNARLGDPVVDVRLRLPARYRTAGVAGAFAAGRGVDVDNLSVVKPRAAVTRLVRDRVPNRLDTALSDEFDGTGAPSAGWTFKRPDAGAVQSGGVLTWPVQVADLVGAGNDAGVLLKDVPDDQPWTVQTKVSVDLGVDTVRNFQQAGIVAYVNDDLFTRLSHVAIWDTRQTEFGKEMPYADRTSYGGTIVGPPATTTWLRITHKLNAANGEHRLRAWTSRDGRTWVKGGVWTLPAGSDIRVGLVAHGAAQGEPQATARFSYFRVYR